MADIVLVNPRFPVSYWGMEHLMPLVGKRMFMPNLGLPLLAALTPAEHVVTIVDETVEPIDFERLARADIVGVTGMIVQRHRMREILRELKRRRVFTAVGGGWVTVSEDYFGDLADTIFVGEAEETWPRFLDDWRQGRPRQRYEQAEPTDVTTLPSPRWDLLRMGEYLLGCLQLSRGCPYVCEFCDIIVTFGRRQRLKTPEQMRAELEGLRDHGAEVVNIVDDNLIGDRRAVKGMLRELVAWQEERGFPFLFVTEATLDLAEDDELLRLMVDANIKSVFVGIESPNEDSLRETKKYQNVRPRHGTIVERVHKIQRAGLDVWGGFMLGFDHDTPAIFEAHRKLLQDARIVHASLGMVYAIPKTPLYERLAAEGRLDTRDQNEFGTNVVPLGMTREELRDGFIRLMREAHEPGAYFWRLEALYLGEDSMFSSPRVHYWRRQKPAARLRGLLRDLARSAYLYWQLTQRVPDRQLRREYARRTRRLLRKRREAAILSSFLLRCAFHFHHHKMARQMAEGRLHSAAINVF